MARKIITLVVLLNILFVGHVFAIEDEKTVYEERLTTFLKDIKSSSPTTGEDLENLWNFKSEYPNSKYVDDVEFVYLFGLFGAHKIKIKEWEALADKNPNGQVSELTKDLYEKYLMVINEMDIPYSLLTLRMKGDDAFWNKKDYAGSANYYIKFLKGLDNTVNSQKLLGYAVYAHLAIDYKLLGDKDAFDKTKSEALAMFPDKSKEINELEF